jgi:hypothetical protein
VTRETNIEQDRRRQEDSVRLVCQVLLNGYEGGEITFEGFCRAAEKATLTALVETRAGLLGTFVSKALKKTPKKRRRGQHGALRTKAVSKTTRELVLAVSQYEGSAKTSPRTIKRVIEILAASGLTLTPDQVRESCRAR